MDLRQSFSENEIILLDKMSKIKADRLSKYVQVFCVVFTFCLFPWFFHSASTLLQEANIDSPFWDFYPEIDSNKTYTGNICRMYCSVVVDRSLGIGSFAAFLCSLLRLLFSNNINLLIRCWQIIKSLK